MIPKKPDEGVPFRSSPSPHKVKGYISFVPFGKTTGNPRFDGVSPHEKRFETFDHSA